MAAQTFEQWLENERKNGLVCISVSVKPNANASVEDVQNELMSLDAAVKAGKVLPLPEPSVFLPECVKDFMDKVSLR